MNEYPSQPLPEGFSLPLGLIVYRISGIQVDEPVLVTMILPAGTQYISFLHYGATPGKTVEHWYEFPFNGTMGSLLDENQAAIQYLDGEMGDADLEVNGVIEEFGGPAGVGSSTVKGWDLYQ